MPCRVKKNGSMTAQSEAEQWFGTNRLLLNKKKTTEMIFTLHDVDNCLECLITAGFLGVTLDTKLQWEPHMNMVAKKLARGVYVKKSLSNCVPLVILKTAYFPIFIYTYHMPYLLEDIPWELIDCCCCTKKSSKICMSWL